MNDQRMRQQLNQAGLRATTSRLAVLALLRRAGRPLSHPDVTTALAKHGFDRATLYRNLTDLTSKGLVRRVELGDRVWRFQVVDTTHPIEAHPHFVCTACGQVLCLPARSVALHARDQEPRALRRGEVEVQLRGVCDRCDPGQERR